MFDCWSRYCEAGPSRWEKFSGSFLWQIEGEPNSCWLVRCDKPPRVVEIAVNASEKIPEKVSDKTNAKNLADCVVAISETDFIAVINKDTSLRELLFAEKLKLAGSSEQALKLAAIVAQFRTDAETETGS